MDLTERPTCSLTSSSAHLPAYWTRPQSPLREPYRRPSHTGGGRRFVYQPPPQSDEDELDDESEHEDEDP
jgi:hypothetical protein